MPIFTMLEITRGNQVHGVRAHRKYDLACIAKLVTDYIYTRLSGGQFNFRDSHGETNSILGGYRKTGQNRREYEIERLSMMLFVTRL